MNSCNCSPEICRGGQWDHPVSILGTVSTDGSSPSMEMVASDWRLVHIAGQSTKTVLTIIGYISAGVECSLSLENFDIW